MDIDNLVTMANRIGEFFDSMPDRNEAKAGIATHISKFWEPRMRTELLAHIETSKETGLSTIVLEAVKDHIVQLQPKH